LDNDTRFGKFGAKFARESDYGKFRFFDFAFVNVASLASFRKFITSSTDRNVSSLLVAADRALIYFSFSRKRSPIA